MTPLRTLDDVIGTVSGKRVLVRVDLNVPMENGVVADATRLERVAPTILELSRAEAKVILLSHLGRPKGVDPKQSLKPVAERLADVVHRPIGFAADCIGEKAQKAIAAMQPGDILCLENTRFHMGEEKNDPAFIKALALLGDIYVNDAFSAAHRAHASTEGLGHVLAAYAGRAMQAEIEALTKALDHPKRPVAAVVGGAKVSTKLDLLGNLVTKVDALVIGGGMANTFLHAGGVSIGASLAERDLSQTALAIMEKAAAANCAVILPVDAIVAYHFAANAPSQAYGIDAIPTDGMILDMGPQSLERIKGAIDEAETILWNGPLGAFELAPFDHATVEAARHVAARTKAGKLLSIAGGGDTVAALNKAGVADQFSYVSTAGGAFLEWLEGKSLPGVDILRA